MADALCSLFDDRAAGERMGRAARARMVARYGWDARMAPLGELLGLSA
jgi:glycosyltransferase involved in cell wall biosynthesis